MPKGFKKAEDTLKRHLPASCRIFIRISVNFFVCSLLLSTITAARAQQHDPSIEGETGIKNEAAQNEPWTPPPPPPDDFDWIQLTSGEWLKGALKVLYEKELEFDSDELDLQKFDWEDVKQVRGHHVFSVRFEGPITVDGLLHVTEDKVFVTVGEERQEFERSKLIAIAPGEPKEINYWSAKINLGLNIVKGNADQLQYNTMWDIRRRTSANRFVLYYLGNFTTADGVDTVDNQRLNAFFDIFMTRKYYFRPVFAEYFRDPFQNIESRATIGAGMGYHILDASKTTWDVTAGLGYLHTRFVSVEPGQDSTASTPAFVGGTLFDRELTKRIDFIANYSFKIVNEESGRYTHHAIATLETEMTTWLDFDISFVWDRTQQPHARADGTIPKKDDFQLIFAVGVDF